MSVARNPRQPRGNTARTGGTMVWLPLDLSDDEVSERMDTDAEEAHAALHREHEQPERPYRRMRTI